MENQSIKPEVSERLETINQVLDGVREESRQAELNPSGEKALATKHIEQHQENIAPEDFADEFEAAVIAISTGNPEDPAIQALAEVTERNAFNTGLHVSRESARMALMQAVNDMRKEIQQKADAAAGKGQAGEQPLIAAAVEASRENLGGLTAEVPKIAGQASRYLSA